MPENRIHVDFNGVEDSDRIVALRRHADSPSAVHPGALIELWDEDGNTAQGRVVELRDRDIVLLNVMWDTWQTPDESEPVREPNGSRSWKCRWGKLAFTPARVIVIRPAVSAQRSTGSFSRTYEAVQGTRRSSYDVCTVAGRSRISR